MKEQDLEMMLAETLKRIEHLVSMQVRTTLNVADVAVMLGVSEGYIRRMVMERNIPHFKNERGGVTFDKAEVEEWRRGKRVPTQAEIEQQAATYCALNPLGVPKRRTTRRAQ